MIPGSWTVCGACALDNLQERRQWMLWSRAGKLDGVWRGIAPAEPSQSFRPAGPAANSLLISQIELLTKLKLVFSFCLTATQWVGYQLNTTNSLKSIIIQTIHTFCSVPTFKMSLIGIFIAAMSGCQYVWPSWFSPSTWLRAVSSDSESNGYETLSATRWLQKRENQTLICSVILTFHAYAWSCPLCYW